jgi:hypothetical protein
MSNAWRYSAVRIPAFQTQFESRKFGSEQEFGGNRILGRFRQMVIFRPDRRHALAFSSRYRRFLYPNEGEVGSKTFRQVRVFG